MFYILIFIFGLSVGSFLNVVICRLETKESILLTRSHCPRCGAVLKWYDLIPVLSFLLQKGKCRYCRKKISIQYPAVEIATGLLFLLILNFKFLIFNQFLILNFLNLFYYLLIICFLLVIFVYDLKHYLIPDKVIYPAIVITFLYRIYSLSEAAVGDGVEGFVPYLLSALLAGAFFLSFVLISKGKWMGLGDVKLAVLMGLVLGWPNILLALFLAFVSGAIVGIGLIVVGKKTIKSQIPFGPFLAGSTILVLLYGSQLIERLFVKLF